MPDFEIITAEEFHRAKPKTSRAKKDVTEPRNLIVWFALRTWTDFCTVPAHDDVQRELKPEELEYRQVYPTRQVYQIGDYKVCRDCFIAQADKLL